MSRNKKLWKLMPVVRALTVLSAVGIITTVATFASIQSGGKVLAGNTIQTATANLQISKDQITFGDSVPGYSFSGLVPGGSAQPTTNGGYVVYLKNSGNANLQLALTVPTQPSVTGTVDLSKVSLLLTPQTGSVQTVPLSNLIAGNVTLSTASLAPGATTYYHIQVSMAADAVSGSTATISGLDLAFSGSAVQ